jgi:hypothetical protein
MVRIRETITKDDTTLGVHSQRSYIAVGSGIQLHTIYDQTKAILNNVDYLDLCQSPHNFSSSAAASTWFIWRKPQLQLGKHQSHSPSCLVLLGRWVFLIFNHRPTECVGWASLKNLTSARSPDAYINVFCTTVELASKAPQMLRIQEKKYCSYRASA